MSPLVRSEQNAADRRSQLGCEAEFMVGHGLSAPTC